MDRDLSLLEDIREMCSYVINQSEIDFPIKRINGGE